MPGKYSVLMALMIMDIGGAETHVLELSKALVKQGLDVYVASNGGIYVKELEENGIKHFKLPLHNKRPLNLIRSYKGLKKIIRENNIDMVHAHARIPAFLCGMLHKRMRFHFVTSAHGTFTTAFPFNILTNWGERSIAVSDDLKEYLLKNYKVAEENISITVNGIDTDKFDGKDDFSGIISEFGLNPDNKRILWVARMFKNNTLGAHLLLDSAESLYAARKDIEIILVGDGDDFENMKRKADKINENVGKKLVTLTGARTDINEFIASCNFFVGVSRSALEAMAAGKPVVLVGNQGYCGIYDKSKEGIALSTNFCFRNTVMGTSAMVEADCLELLTKKDSAELEALGEFGRETVRKYYSVLKMALDTKAVYDEILKTDLKENDIVVSGYYGSRNSGDDALLKSITDSFKEYGKSIVVLSRRPKETSEIFGVASINWLNIFAIIRTMKDSKLLVMGGGNLMQDGTSTRNLYYYIAIIRLAERYGTKVMLYSNGIGPVRREKNRLRAANCLNNYVDSITLRDEKSLVDLRGLGVTRPPAVVTADAAFALITGGSPAEKVATSPCDGEYFVVSVRGWKKLDAVFEDKIARIADEIKRKYGLQAVFVSMQDEFDLAISKRVCRKMMLGGILNDKKQSLPEIISVIENSRFVLGMRLHTLIYAARAGVPVIGLVYDPKVEAIMEYMGQRFYAGVEVVDEDRIISYADEIMGNYEGISQKLAEKSQELREKALMNTKIALELMKRVD